MTTQQCGLGEGTHHYACECRERRFQEIEAERDQLRAEVDRSHKAILALTSEVEASKKLLHIAKCCHNSAEEDCDKERKRAEVAELQLRDWIDAVKHLRHCGVCSEDAMKNCDEGAKIEAMLEKGGYLK